jgi:dTDP-4-dehydrorhamnose reductase
MKILITGISGLLGTTLAQELSAKDHEVYGITRGSTLPGFKVYEADITEQKLVYDTVSRINPDIVIHTATLTNVDECERNPDEAYRINALGTRNIAVACQRFDTVLAYISTDYAFSGENPPERGYTEFDVVDPISAYGKSKLAGEWYVRHQLNKFFILRTSWLFGSARSNFVLQMAEAFKTGKTIKAVTDMVSSPTYVKDLAEGISRLLETTRYGLYHLSNAGFASRYEIATRIATMMKADRSGIQKLQLKDLNLPARRPAFSAMSNYVWELEGFKPLRTWQESVYEFLQDQRYI